jgi:hypothetical protein
MEKMEKVSQMMEKVSQIVQVEERAQSTSLQPLDEAVQRVQMVGWMTTYHLIKV